MGYRPNIVERSETEYGKQMWGFSYKVNTFHNVLWELGLEFDILNDDESVEIDAESIRNLNIDLDKASDELKTSLLSTYCSDGDEPKISWDELKECLNELIQDLKKALDTRYCKKYNVVRIEWF